jgi:RNA polymerase sigma-70 factor, ECF subfamily
MNPTAGGPIAATSQREDHLGFEAFYRQTWARLFDTARRMAGFDHDVAQDVTQQAYMVMLRQWPCRRDFSLEDNRRYATAIIWNKIADHFRYWRRLDLLPEGFEGDPVVSAEPLPESQALLTAIDRQPARRRIVAVLYFLEDFSCEEIASVMGTSASTVRTHIQRARADLVPYAEKLRDALEEGMSP